MPKRSNIFQRLVAEMHRSLGPGWAVGESQELSDSLTGEQREVDLVARATVGGYPIVLCIEVRDRGRPADVTWVESMARKHQDLPTSKLVLWSSSGFTAAARTKAAAIAIELVVPDDAVNAPWARIAREFLGGTLKYVRPQFDAFADVQMSDGKHDRWPAPAHMTLKQVGGTQQTTVGAILNQMSDNPRVREVLLDHAPLGSGSFHAVYQPPFAAVAVAPDGTERPLNRLMINIETLTEEAPVVARSALRDETVTTLVEAEFTDGRLQVVAREPVSGSATVSAEFRPRNHSA